MSAVYLLLFKCLTELCKLYKYRPVTKGLYCKRYINGFNGKHLIFIHFSWSSSNDRYTVWSVILWLVHWPPNIFIGYSINSLSSLVNQTLKGTVEDPGFEKSLVKHKCPSSNTIPNGYFSIEVKVIGFGVNETVSLVEYFTYACQNKVSTFKVPKIWPNFKFFDTQFQTRAVKETKPLIFTASVYFH